MTSVLIATMTMPSDDQNDPDGAGLKHVCFPSNVAALDAPGIIRLGSPFPHVAALRHGNAAPTLR